MPDLYVDFIFARDTECFTNEKEKAKKEREKKRTERPSYKMILSRTMTYQRFETVRSRNDVISPGEAIKGYEMSGSSTVPRTRTSSAKVDSFNKGFLIATDRTFESA